MATQRIEFTEWTPDRPTTVTNLSLVKNVIPAVIGYIPFQLSVSYSNAASESLNNVFAARFSDSIGIFAGSASSLYKMDGATLNLSDVSKTAAASYSGITKWNFIQFGDTVIAANNKDKLQSYTIGTSTRFADLAAAAPIAKYVTVVRDFVVAANLDAGSNANKLQWSNINDETNWTAGAASQSDFQIIPDGGNIQGITGGEFGLILLDRAIVRMTYIGSPYFFQFDTITKGIGCLEGSTVVKYGNTTYFLGQDGFYSCDGQSITPIGNEKIDRWFFNYANPSKFSSISTAVDPFKKIVVWNFLNNFGTRSLLIYNWQVNRWSYCDTDVDIVAAITTPSMTLEGLDLYGNMDTIQTSFDDILWAGGKFLFVGSVDKKITTFTGANLDAQIITGDIGSEMTSIVTLARPIVENGSASVALASRTLLNDYVIFGSDIDASSENRVSLRGGGKYHRFSIKPKGSQWKNALALEVNVESQGVR